VRPKKKIPRVHSPAHYCYGPFLFEPFSGYQTSFKAGKGDDEPVCAARFLKGSGRCQVAPAAAEMYEISPAIAPVDTIPEARLYQKQKEGA